MMAITLSACQRQAAPAKTGGDVNAADALNALYNAPITPESVKKFNIEQATYHPIHFKPMIEKATDEQCLACHSEVLKTNVRESSLKGIAAQSPNNKAWYQQVNTYTGDQATFHQRHIATEFSKKVMKLNCNFCHQGNDPREETPWQNSTGDSKAAGFTMRKMVNAEDTCLRCHGSFPSTVMNLSPWPEIAESMGEKGCMTCHESLFRTVRHQVNYLHADEIEKLATNNSEVCFGCHGGRQWYRISFPYPRHPWPNMAPDTPDWAKGRMTASEARFLVGINALPSSGAQSAK